MFLLLLVAGGDGVAVEGRETVQDVQPRHAELSEDSLTLLGQQLGQAEPGLEGAERSEEEKVLVKYLKASLHLWKSRARPSLPS